MGEENGVEYLFVFEKYVVFPMKNMLSSTNFRDELTEISAKYSRNRASNHLKSAGNKWHSTPFFISVSYLDPVFCRTFYRMDITKSGAFFSLRGKEKNAPLLLISAEYVRCWWSTANHGPEAHVTWHACGPCGASGWGSDRWLV
jgi:hypothetical protein